MLQKLFIIGLFSLLAACAPPRYSYDDAVSAKPLASGAGTQTRVSAAVEDWRNSGVSVERGKTYKLTATGKWRTYRTCNFTHPDGIGLYKPWCDNTPLFPPIIKGYSHSMLIAKIDNKGMPFVVGNELEFTAEDSGTLFFRINDALGGAHDNEGYANVSIRSMEKPKGNMAKQTVAPPPTFVPPQPEPVVKAPVQTDYQPSSAVNIVPSMVQRLAGKRTALVIGNSNYEFSPLKNPANDAKGIADSLKALGFEVELLLDANQQKMEEAIDRFGRKLLQDRHVALFYYAGHGVQVNGENYLIPTEAVINRQADVRYKAVNIGHILSTMGEAQDNLNIVILDACRDNPLPRSFRSGSRGLARVEGPKGTIIGFATSPGSVASDGADENGVYTKHFLQNMNTPGLSIEDVFKRVLQGVNQETGGQQVPWMESSFTGDFSFKPD